MKKISQKSAGEELLALLVKDASIPAPEREYKFHPKRRWRFDFAWPDYRIAAEIEGGVWSGGRHTRGSGFSKDCEKYNNAVLLGWRVLRFPTGAVHDGTAIAQLEIIFELSVENSRMI